MFGAFAQSYEHPTVVFIFAATFEFDRIRGFYLVVLLCQEKSSLIVCGVGCSSFGAFSYAHIVSEDV